eukprot:gene8328-152_t
MSCKYETSGCNFNTEGDISTHETTCPYRFVEENKKLTDSLGVQDPTKTFAIELWDKFPEVIEKLKKGHKDLTSFMKFLSAQASTLDSYGSVLAKQLLPIEYIGEFTEPFHRMTLYAHYTGDKYNYIACVINNHMLKELSLLCDEINAVIKDTIALEKSSSKELEVSTTNAKNSKTDNLKLKTTSDQMIEDLKKKKGDLDFKNWLKISNNVYSSDHAHKLAILNQESSNEFHFQTMSNILQTIQNLEIKRVKMMKSTLLTYKNLMKELADEVKKGNDSLKQATDAMSDEAEIKEFVLSLKTGKQKDPYMDFEPYQIQQLE